MLTLWPIFLATYSSLITLAPSLLALALLRPLCGDALDGEHLADRDPCSDLGERAAERREVHGGVEEPREVGELVQRRDCRAPERNGERPGAPGERATRAPCGEHEHGKGEHEHRAHTEARVLEVQQLRDLGLEGEGLFLAHDVKRVAKSAAELRPASRIFKRAPTWNGRTRGGKFGNGLLKFVIDRVGHYSVHGAKPGDTLEIDCNYRAPIALVKWGNFYWLVDGDGVKLPEGFSRDHVSRIVVGQDRKINIRIVEGIEHAPPESGRKWVGADLAAALGVAAALINLPIRESAIVRSPHPVPA